MEGPETHAGMQSDDMAVTSEEASSGYRESKNSSDDKPFLTALSAESWLEDGKGGDRPCLGRRLPFLQDHERYLVMHIPQFPHTEVSCMWKSTHVLPCSLHL